MEWETVKMLGIVLLALAVIGAVIAVVSGVFGAFPKPPGPLETLWSALKRKGGEILP